MFLKPVIGVGALAERAHFGVSVAGVQPAGLDHVVAGVEAQGGHTVVTGVCFQVVEQPPEGFENQYNSVVPAPYQVVEPARMTESIVSAYAELLCGARAGFDGISSA